MRPVLTPIIFDLRPTRGFPLTPSYINRVQRGPITWNPSTGFNKYSGAVLSGNNLTSTPDGVPSNYETVRATVPSVISAFRFEVTLASGFTPANLFVGIDSGQTNYAVAGNVAGSSDSLGVTLQIFGGQWYIVRNGGTAQGPFASPAPAASQIVTVVGDKGAQTLGFYVNGTQIGVNETSVTFTDWYAYTSGKGADGAGTGNFSGPFSYGSNPAYDGTPSSSVNGSLNSTLGTLTLSSTAQLLLKGSVNQTLDSLTGTKTGQLLLKGSVNKTLGALTLSSTGTLKLSGSLNKTLGALTLSSTGTLKIAGSLNKTLGSLTGTETGQLLIKGSVNKTLGAVTLSSTGTLGLSGSVNKTLGSLSLSSTGKVILSGSLNKTLGSLSGSETGQLIIKGSVNKTLGSLTLVSVLQGSRIGSVSVTLGPTVLVSKGRLRSILIVPVGGSSLRSGIVEQLVQARKPHPRVVTQRVRN